MKQFVILLVLAFMVFSNNTSAEMLDFVYSENGNIIKGVVIEPIFDASIKIETDDGTIFAYQMSEIEKIEKIKKGKYINPVVGTMWSILGGSVWWITANIERPNYNDGGSMFAIITHTTQLLSFTFGQNYINVKLGTWWKDRNMDRPKIYKLLRMGVSVIVSNLVIERSYRKGSKTMFSAGILVGLATHMWLGIDTCEWLNI